MQLEVSALIQKPCEFILNVDVLFVIFFEKLLLQQYSDGKTVGIIVFH
jgi:hypothetical protein